MARPPRMAGVDTWHHVMTRGADRQDLFHDDADRIAFECLIDDAGQRHRTEIHAYCLMTNHVHLLMYCPADGLSETMQLLCSRYGAQYNHRYERTGPLFGGRFRSVMVDTDAQLAQVSRYIHRNPIPITGERAMSNYRWSSLGPYVGSRACPAWLHTDQVLAGFDGSPDSYRTFVDTPQPTDADHCCELIEFRPGCSSIENAVARAAHVDVRSLHETRPNMSQHPRLAAMLLISRLRRAPAAELAERFGLTSQSGARSATRRARVLLASDPGFQQLWAKVNDLLAYDPGTFGV